MKRLPLLLAPILFSAAALSGCKGRSCEEVTADRVEVLEQSQRCSADTECAVFGRSQLLGSGCGVIALRKDVASRYAERERELAEEAEDSCDEEDNDNLESALGEAISCSISSIFVSANPADYEGKCNQNACVSVRIVPQ